MTRSDHRGVLVLVGVGLLLAAMPMRSSATVPPDWIDEDSPVGAMQATPADSSRIDYVPLADADGDDSHRFRKRTFARLSYEIGYVIPVSGFLKGNNLAGEPIEWYQTARAEFGWQTTGTRYWQQLYGYPSYGLGILGTDMFNEDELGQPTALYGWFIWPVARKRAYTINTEFGFGLSSNWKGWDYYNNPHNTVMGLNESIYISLGGALEFPLSRRLDLHTGVTFTHFSNGATAEPNWGINQLGIRTTLDYNFQGDRRAFVRRAKPQLRKTHEIAVFIGGNTRGVRFDTRDPASIEKYADESYPVLDLTGTYLRRVGPMSKIGGGLDVWYDSSTDARIELGSEGRITDSNVSEWDKISMGVHFAYEHVVNTVSFVGHGGFAFKQTDFEGQETRFYQRAGIKWHFYRDVFAGLHVRAVEFSKAVFLEYHVGYRFRLGERG